MHTDTTELENLKTKIDRSDKENRSKVLGFLLFCTKYYWSVQTRRKKRLGV